MKYCYLVEWKSETDGQTRLQLFPNVNRRILLKAVKAQAREYRIYRKELSAYRQAGLWDYPTFVTTSEKIADTMKAE